MNKMKSMFKVLVKDKNLQKVAIGSIVLVIGLKLICDGSEGWGKLLGGEEMIKIAETMQPGFYENLKAFVKENY